MWRARRAAAPARPILSRDPRFAFARRRAPPSPPRAARVVWCVLFAFACAAHSPLALANARYRDCGVAGESEITGGLKRRDAGSRDGSEAEKSGRRGLDV